jgi:hypothetical protein
MTPDDLATIEAVAASYNRQIRIGCTGCAYCMPCPFGVNIPQNFFLYNNYFMGNKLMSRGFYGLTLMGTMGERGDAALCKNCGKCAKACPQKIAIPDELRKVKGQLGGLRTKILIPLVKMMFSGEVKE